MPRRTPSESASKWNKNLIASTTEIELGVNKVTESPMAKAVAMQDKMEDNWLAALRSGKWARNTERVTLAEWKNAMIQVGIGRIRAGADKAVPKLQRYYERVFPQMQSLQDEIAAMPSRDINDSIAKATKWITGMSQIANSL